MTLQLMEALNLAAKWLSIDGVEGISANEERICIEVFVLDKTNHSLNKIPNNFKGFDVAITNVEA